jgi:hypothetical protein
MRRIIEAGAIALMGLTLLGAARPELDWRALEPAETLVIS